MSDSTLPFLSVILPVFNDAERLALCLQALEQQSYPQARYEIIVVDNGSTDRQAVIDSVSQFQNALVLHEVTPGSYAARNTGIRHAKGPIIAFTDADCIPDSDWLEMGAQTLLNTSNCGCVAGRIEVFVGNSQRVTPVELYDSITAFPQRDLLETHHYGATANLFTFKHVIQQVGEFNSRLKSGGDLEWGQRVYAAGYQQVYADNVRVLHPARRSFADLYRRSLRLSGGIYDLYVKSNPSKWHKLKAFVRILLDDLVTPFIFAIQVRSDSRFQTFRQKLQVSLMMFLARYVRAGELIRLQFGGVSTRS